MKTDTPVSAIRRRARRIILQVIEDNVLGPVVTLPNGDVLELRVKLREAYPWATRKGWNYHVWCQEVRLALGCAPRRKSRPRKPKLYQADHVMPAMREWAKGQGILIEPEPVEAESEIV